MAERGELVRQGELMVCGGARRKRAGVRSVFLYQHVVVFTKQKTLSPGRITYSYKHSIKVQRPHTHTQQMSVTPLFLGVSSSVPDLPLLVHIMTLTS